MKKIKQLLSFLTAICVVMTSVVIFSQPTAFAAGGDGYVAASIENSSYTVDKSSSTTLRIQFTSNKIGAVSWDNRGWATCNNVNGSRTTIAETTNSNAYYFDWDVSSWSVGSSYTISASAKVGAVVFYSVQYRTDTVTATVNITCNHSKGYTSTSTDSSHLKSAATCTSAAVYYKSCSTCGANGTATFNSGSSLGHNFTSKTTTSTYLKSAANCTSKAVYYYKCSRCTASSSSLSSPTTYTSGSVDSTNHNWGSWIQTTAPTCTTAGVETRTCTRNSSHTETRTGAAATGHTPNAGTVTTPATCTANGLKTYNCTVCGAVTSTETIPALGHNADSLSHVYENTRTADTLERTLFEYHCSRCGQLQNYSCGSCGTVVYTPETGWISGAYYIEALAPTCTLAGGNWYRCSNCNNGLTWGDLVIATGHSYSWVQTTAPTCTAAGVESYRCSNCGDVSETRAIAATGHTEVIDAAVAPTCTETGLTQGSHCSVCNTVLVAQKVVPATGHAWGEWTVTTPATCTATGVETRVCANDANHTETRDIAIDPNNHDFQFTETVAPKCTEAGYDIYTCSRCEATEHRNEVEATGHAWGEWTVTTPATCTTTGVETRVCANDASHTETRDIAIDPNNHTAIDAEWTVTLPATCTSSGTRVKYCQACHEIAVSETITALGHDFTSETKSDDYLATPATCTADATYYYKCTRCAEKDTSNTWTDIGSATGHAWGEWTVTTPATCTTTGVETRVCANDSNHTETRDIAIDPNNHDFQFTETVAPTCTEAGYDIYTCSRCEATEHRNEVEATGHAWGEWTVTIPATCTATGVETRVCANDANHTETRDIAIDPNNHDFQFTETVAPTCTEAGYDIYTCSRCDATEHRNEVEATGHAYGEWTVTTPATCTTTGVETRVCANDSNHTETRDIAIDSSNHTAIDAEWTVTLPATCTSSGTRVKYCQACHEIAVSETITALGHDFTSETKSDDYLATPATCTADATYYYKCTRCAEKDTSNTWTDIGSATGHAWGEWTVTTPATCTATGVETRVCANDSNHTETRDIAIDPNNHDFQFTETVAPTCTEAGYDIYTCSRCEATEHRNEVEATGHTWDEGTITTAPTCTQTGVKTFNCINCDATRTETVAVIDHTAGTRTVEIVDGVEKYVTRCTQCGTIISVEEIEGADYTALNEAVAKANALNTVEYYDVSAVTSAVNAVVTGLNAEHQAEVDAMTASINDAIAGLKKIVSLMTVNRATVKQNGETITIMMSEGAASSALSSVLKNNDSVTISNIENLTVSKDGRYVAKSNAFATMTLKDGRQYNLVFKPYALDISADGIRTIMVDRTSIVVDNDARTITMNSESNKPYVVIYNTISGSPITIENADLYTEYRYKIERPASMKFESTLTIKGIEYALRVNFMPYFEAEADGFTTMFVKEDTIQIDNAARTITMHSTNNATYAVIYNYYGGYKSGKSVTIDDAELYSTYRWKIEKPEGGVFNSTIYVDGVPFDLTVYFDEVLTKKEVKYEISGTDIIIRSITTDKTEITVPATMTIGETTYNVVIGKTVLEQAEDGYMDPVSGVFYNNRNITKVTFEDGVRVEDNDAEYLFSNSSVQEVYNLPDSITDMYACFYNCTALTTVDAIPESVTELGYAFNRCRALTGDLTINAENVTNIDRNVFRYAGQNGGLTIYATGDTYTAILEKGSLGANVKLEQF